MKEKVYEHLKSLNIEFKIYEHPALYTCADNDKYGLVFDGERDKNLFLRNKNKSKYYLVSMPENKPLNLKDLALKLEESKLSFGNEEELFNKLKIKPGAVSFLNIIASGDTDVVVIVDEGLIKAERVCFHPNDNTATITFNSEHIEKILGSFKVEYKFLDI
jgi:Ala-tRNA(Pro) deacylase